MADEFDIIDYVYNAVAPVASGFIVYKKRSITAETNNHIVINHLNLNADDDEEIDFTNILPVNVNVFVKLNTNGMSDIPTMKTAIRAIRTAIKNISSVNGQYRHAHIAWTGDIEGIKDGFDCTNIRIDFQTDK